MKRDESVRFLIKKLSSLHYRAIHFSPRLEEKYASSTDLFRRRRQAFEGLLILALYIALAVASRLMQLDGLRVALRGSADIWAAAALFACAVLWIHFAGTLREGAITITICTAGTIEVFHPLIRRSHGAQSPYLPVIAIFVVANTITRLRTPYAVMTFLWGIGTEAFAMHLAYSSTGSFDFLEPSLVAAIGLLTVVANYSQNRELRLAFLKHVQAEDLAGSLAKSNRNLAVAANTDSLTGVANRSALESYLQKVWSDPSLSSDACSILMMDIDHFKQLNDRYGHPYGDRVLKRVAHLLSEALRGEDDFIARYGGEEFIVVLPKTSLALALVVAERLRGLVELAGLPALRAVDLALDGLCATISCGVSANLPSNAQPERLIERADQALYRAKLSGRNQVQAQRTDADETVKEPVGILESNIAPRNASLPEPACTPT